MRTRQMARISIIGMLVTVCVGCKDEKVSCVNGKMESCPCPNGANGIQTCKNGQWAVCDCTGDGDEDTDADCVNSISDFDSCLDCYCGDEMNVCEDNADCQDLLSCLNVCGSDADCQATCASDFPDGVNDLVEVLDCRDTSCTDYMTDAGCEADVTDFDSCLSCYCEDYLIECETESDCLDLLYCLGDCAETDTVCQEECIINYADGVDPLINVLDCRDANCSDYLT